MSDRCGHCQHQFQDPDGYYSVDFARYFSRKPAFMLIWCFHCNHICVATQPWHFRLFRVPMVRLKNTLPVSALADLPYSKVKDPGMGGFAGGHLLRMAWHCLNARVTAEQGHENPEAALHLCLEKLPPREAALMIMMTVNARNLVPLEQQLQEGMYLQDVMTLDMFQQWLTSCRNRKAAAGTLEMLRGYESAKPM